MVWNRIKIIFVAVFLLLLLAPAVAFIIVLYTDKSLAFYYNNMNIIENKDYYINLIREKTHLTSEADINNFWLYLISWFNYDMIPNLTVIKVLAILGIIFVIIGGFLLIFPNLFFTPARHHWVLSTALVSFWIVTITGFLFIAISQYKFNTVNILNNFSMNNIDNLEDIPIYNNYKLFPSLDDWKDFLRKLSNDNDIIRSENFLQHFLYNNFYSKLHIFRHDAHNWLGQKGVWYFLLVQSILVSFIATYDYTSYTSYLVSKRVVNFSRNELVVFNKGFFKKLIISFKEPTIWNILRILIIFISFIIILQILSIIISLANYKLSLMYKGIDYFPLGLSKLKNFLSKEEWDVFLYVILKIHCEPEMSAVFSTNYLQIFALTLSAITLTSAIILFRRINWLSERAIILFYILFAILLISSFVLSTYSDIINNEVVKLANNKIDEYVKNNLGSRYYYYFQFSNGNLSEAWFTWTIFSIRLSTILFLIIYNGLLSFKAYRYEILRKKSRQEKYLSFS